MVLGMVIFVYVTIDFFGRIQDLLAASFPTSRILIYFLYRVPMIVSLVTPAVHLLSILIVFGLMSKNNEIVALRSGGISEYYLMAPVLMIGIVISIILFFFNESIVPVANARENKLWAQAKNKPNLVTTKEKNIWIRGDRSITHIDFYDPRNHQILGVTIVYFDDQFHMTQRIDAKKGQFQNNQWMLYGCLTQTFTGDAESVPAVYSEIQSVDLQLLPEDLQRVQQKAEEMSFSNLRKFIQKVESQGYDVTKYRVDLYAKTAFPFVCFIMSLMGSGLALRGKTREGMAASFAYGILTAFGYWGVLSFCLSLGYGDMMPAWVSAWIANALFFCVGAILLINIEE